MNFAKLYPGDYMRDTGALTVTQHGAYLLMLLNFYATEAALPTGRELHRLLRAESKLDRDAIDYVAAKFWRMADDGSGLVNDRALREIEQASRQRAVNREVGKLGGRPKGSGKRTERDAGEASTETDSVSDSVSDSLTESEPNRNPLQTPEKAYPSSPQGDESADADPKTAKEGSAMVPCPYQTIVDAYHEALPELPSVRLITEPRRRAMRKRWAWVLSSHKADGTRRATTGDEALAWLRTFFGRVRDNDWLMGRAPRSAEHAGWQCDLDYLLTERGLLQVVEKTRSAA